MGDVHNSNKKNPKNIKIFDIISTSQGAYRLLRTRVEKINKEKNMTNIIICPPGEYNNKIRNMGIEVIDINFSRGLNPFKILKEIREIERVIKREKPDIIHTHNSKTGVIGRMVAYRLNKKDKYQMKIIHQVHGFHFTQFNGLKNIFYKYIEFFMAKKTDLLLFQNFDEFNLAKEIGMDKHCKLMYIGNGIPFEEFDSYIKKEKKGNKETKIISCVSRIEPVKNHEMIIESLNILENEYHFYNYLMYFIGEGNQENLKNLINKYKLKGNILFTGQLDRNEVIKILHCSDLSVLTSYKEGKPRALMESSALGVPVVATDVIGTREVVKDGVTGYLVPLNDYKSFANKMYELLTNEKRWEEFSENAKEVAKKEFDENNVVNQLKIIYNSVTTQKENKKNKGPII